MKEPELSIITVCFNAEKSIRKTLQSVLEQTWTDFEYIIKDGNSTDRTCQLVEEYAPLFAKRGIACRLIRCQDKGIYDAMNQGLVYASGKWVNFLNADDWYLSPDTLQTVSRAFSAAGNDILCGDAVEEEYGRRFLFAAAPEEIEQHHAFCHQAAFIRMEWMKRYGYDTSFRIAGDYDFFLHAYHDGAQFRKLGQKIVAFGKEGVSTNHVLWIKEETLRVRHRYGYLEMSRGRERITLLTAAVKQFILLCVPARVGFWLRNLTRRTKEIG